MADAENIDLHPSKLGTKEYWDNVYEQEITNFEDFGDEGEVWFGQESVEKMVDWALSHIPPTSSSSSSSSPPSSSSSSSAAGPRIIEIGSGNGNLLFALAEAGYNPQHLLGIDYSGDAVRLAREVGKEKGGGCEGVGFGEVDFLRASMSDVSRLHGEEEGGGKGGGWDLVLDKGTYDAIALAERDEEGRRPCDAYPGRVAELLEPGGLFLITSCNFTREELLRAFETPETGLRYQSVLSFLFAYWLSLMRFNECPSQF